MARQKCLVGCDVPDLPDVPGCQHPPPRPPAHVRQRLAVRSGGRSRRRWHCVRPARRSSLVARRCAHANPGAHRNTGTQEHRKLAHKQLAHRRASYCLETLWPLQPRAARAMSACSTLAERAGCTQESKQGRDRQHRRQRPTWPT